MQDMPVTSAICQPVAGSTVKATRSFFGGGDGTFVVKGYAWSGQGNRIARVDITTDGGKTW